MAGGAAFKPFFLPAEPGSRFALFHSTSAEPQGGFLYVHPFGEEMNKSRRMAALQSRAFAAAGYAVLQVDLYGCGDSAGETGDACWEIWKRDLALAADWLAKKIPARLHTRLHIWGLRLGATLALDFWHGRPERFASALLWQPVLDGHTFMTQFLRMAVAGDVLQATGSGVSTESLRRQSQSGEAIEVAGYELAPPLVAAVDRQKLNDWVIPGATLHWLEVKGSVTDAAPPAVQKQLSHWRGSGMRVDYQAILGDQFWTTQEITEAPALVEASLALYKIQSS